MERSDAEASPLSAAPGTTGPASEAFELLSNETRLAILVALWDAYDPFDGENAVRFSDLREAVGVTDSGQFNYHLEKLTGHFVESTDEGYELREPGRKFVRSVVAGAGIEEPTLEPTEIDMDCSLCGGAVEVGYEDGWVYNACTECDGLFAGEDTTRGHLSKFKLDPAGFTGRSPEEIYATAWVRAFQRLYTMIEGVCPSCSGPVERSLARCESHDDDGVCDECGRGAAVTAQFECPVCKDWAVTTLGGVAKYHPAAVAFHYERDLSLQYGFNDLASINERLETGRTDWEVLSDDPLRVLVTLELDGDELRLELAEDLSVADVTGPR
ncbi:winged helix-turn-helix domain-containing protein [Halosimplex salinum]|uniref:winged helix-turn-helix domain-containing protein n=1 Tax=Halosimplex salinum TaxID=1710538 RepID=UPI000F47A56E|nr:winged helix-turn-helix domain-containing protein [Halosimplex salinum]